MSRRIYFDLKAFRKGISAKKSALIEAEKREVDRAYALPPPADWTIETFLSRAKLPIEAAPLFEDWNDFISSSKKDLFRVSNVLNAAQVKKLGHYIELFNRGLWPSVVPTINSSGPAREGLPWTEEETSRMHSLAVDKYGYPFGNVWMYLAAELERTNDEVRDHFFKTREIKLRESELCLSKSFRPLLMNRQFRLIPPQLIIVPSKPESEDNQTFTLPRAFANASMVQISGILRSKVFIGNIPTTVEESEVREVVLRSGKVIGFFYLRDVQGGDRGFALVTYSNEDEAQLAVASLNEQQIFENSVRPLHAKLTCEKIEKLTPDLVFVDPGKPLPSSTWEEYTSEEGHPYYHNTTTGETVWERPKYFVPAATANLANMEMITGTTSTGAAVHISSGYGPLGANLFIFHIPPDWKDEDLRDRFESQGQLVSCKISCEDNGRSRGFGFVSYTTRESAANALHALNGIPAGGKYLKVTIKQGEEEYAVEPTLAQRPGNLG